eukprot:TRINITY_DN36652_c0_g1_i1.p1 TRINITY_DN36652_c0_g1~~TRINITY_DN36652_c0_g1_i1.p1  ORF type:complete len:215 (+),score=25.51 TRINITY_DN36652_c0_g1_i1:64-708(+)
MPHYSSTEYDVLIKIIIVGDPTVGKSSLLHQYTEADWNPSYITTIGVDFKSDTFEARGRVVKLQMWDTAGQERFKTIVASYYRGTHCVVLVFDVTNRESFEHIAFWKKEALEYAKPGVPMLLIGNKADLPTREVTLDEAEQFASDNGMKYIETSAKTADNVQNAFRDAVDTALDQRMELIMEETKKYKKYLSGVPVVKPKSCFKRFLSAFRIGG